MRRPSAPERLLSLGSPGWSVPFGIMLSPEAERVMRYLVEVEELAEDVLADKRQVETRGPGFRRSGLVAPRPCSKLTLGSGSRGFDAGPGGW